MKKNTLFFIIMGFALLSGGAHAATKCSIANLTRCLDSVCAINMSSNPAARCQYCGTSGAGVAQAVSEMRGVSVGASAKYTLTAKELKKAPTDPGARYVWATAECMKRVDGCTTDDVTDNYDKLIEQSCRAAGITAEMASLRTAATKPASKSSCQTNITSCIVAATKCNADWRACSDDAEFNKFFAACSVDATGCDEYTSDIRTTLIASRDNAIKNADNALAGIVAAYQSARESKLNAAQASCRDNAGRTACMNIVCERSMPNKCAAGFESENTMANALCKFYDVACNLLK